MGRRHWGRASADEGVQDAPNFIFDVFAEGMEDDGPPWKDAAGSQPKLAALPSADDTADLWAGVPKPPQQPSRPAATSNR